MQNAFISGSASRELGLSELGLSELECKMHSSSARARPTFAEKAAAVARFA